MMGSKQLELFPLLVRCGCLGCLTDDCEHWGTPECTLKDFTPCLLGRELGGDVLEVE